MNERYDHVMGRKAPTGIEGFDEIAHGGLPRGRTTLVMGGPGTGKTVFGLRTLVAGARRWGEPGIFVAFEESFQQIIENAASFGWDLPALERQKLFFLDAHLPSNTVKAGEFDLGGMLARLGAKASEMGAKRIVFDSLDVLLAFLDDPIAERREIYRIRDWLSRTGLTGILTARMTGPNEALSAQRYAFIQYMADCVVLLSYHVANRVAFRAVRILKYRGSSFEQNEFPLVIGPRGMEVASLVFAEAEYPLSSERISTGIAGLDTMLDGGYVRGASALVTGAPGTAKSTLCGAFVEAACKRGERCLYIGLDEVSGEVVRNLTSVGIELASHVESGLLRMYSVRVEARSAEEHLLRIKALLNEHTPMCMAIDPISALVKAGGPLSALAVAQRLLYLAKAKGITLMLTSLTGEADPLTESANIAVSTIADVWLHLSYVVKGGERNRALTIIKARGTRHSNQVRELVLSDTGITLAEVYTAGGEVLMGTLRWERENAEQRERARLRVEAEHKRRELDLALQDSRAHIEALQRQLEAQQAESALLREEQEAREASWERQEQHVRRMRRGDAAAPAGPEDGAPNE